MAVLQFVNFIQRFVPDHISIHTVHIIENLSVITAGSPMVRAPINLVQRPISPGLIKDLWIKPLRPKTSKKAKGHERKVELPGIEPRAIGLTH